MVEQFPEVRQGLESIARERQEANRAAPGHARAACRSSSFLAQGLMEAQSLLVLDLERCTRCDALRARLRRRARRRDAPDARRAALRQISGGDFLPPMPRSAVHGRVSGGLDSAPQFARSDHRGLVHRLRPVRARTARTATSTCIRSRCRRTIPTRPGARKAVVQQKATSCDLCTDHAEPSCVYACPHDAAHRVEPREFFAPLLGIASPRTGTE